MIDIIFLGASLVLAFSFGRNVLGNVFGSAVGTGMLSLKKASLLMGIFVAFGALLASGPVTSNLTPYIHFSGQTEVIYFALILAVILLIMNACGLPVSLAQLGMSGLIGWGIHHSAQMDWAALGRVLQAWIFSPVISGLCAFILFKFLRFFFQKYPVPLLHRDLWVRFHMIWIGCLMAFMVGSNNLSVIIQPFVFVENSASFEFKMLVCLFVFLGAWLASQKVIQTLSRSLFPLSAVEAMIMSFATALTLFLFSSNIPFLPTLPISTGAALIGAIVGISLAKGGYGLKVKPLLWVISSWVWIPLLTGLTCYGVMSILSLWRLI